jgi:NADPH:quinone reductase-like Zn-dependent oxidoreductase
VVRVVELPQPKAGPGEVVVRVSAATVNPTDTLMRAGKQVAMMAGLEPPFVAGMEFAGHVHAVGAGVSALAVGQPVMGLVNPRRPERGAHAEFVVAPVVSVVALPPSIDLAEAATVPMNGLTALMAIEALGLARGASVLVTGAAGAVGGYVIQLARHAGLRIVADAKPADVDLVRRCGADEIVPRGEAMPAALRQLHPQGVDGLVDAALLGERAAGHVRDGGVAVTLRKANPIVDPRLTVRHVSVTDRVDDGAALQRVAQWLRDGVLTPRVAARLPLAEAAQANRLVEQGGLRGRVVLVPDAG